MATEIWRKFPHIIQDLLDNPTEYRFYQALRLAEEIIDDQKAKLHHRLPAAIRLKPAPQISFPAADLRFARINDQGRIELDINFMGFYGVDSPLPHYFIDLAAGKEDVNGGFRAFLDIFNRRVYELLFKAWQKHHPSLFNQKDHINNRYLAALAGNMQVTDSTSNLSFAGLVGNRIKNDIGLTGMVTNFLGNMPTTVKQFVGTWITLNQETIIGDSKKPLSLGENVLLGNRVLDVSRKIEVELGPMSAERATRLLPGETETIQLGELIRSYLPPTAVFDIILIVRPEKTKSQKLGANDLMLGWNTCLGRWQDGMGKIRIPDTGLFTADKKAA